MSKLYKSTYTFILSPLKRWLGLGTSDFKGNWFFHVTKASKSNLIGESHILPANTYNEFEAFHIYSRKEPFGKPTLTTFSPKLLKTIFVGLKALTFTLKRNVKWLYAFKNNPSGCYILSLLRYWLVYYLDRAHSPFQTIMTFDFGARSYLTNLCPISQRLTPPNIIFFRKFPSQTRTFSILPNLAAKRFCVKILLFNPAATIWIQTNSLLKLDSTFDCTMIPYFRYLVRGHGAKPRTNRQSIKVFHASHDFLYYRTKRTEKPPSRVFSLYTPAPPW